MSGAGVLKPVVVEAHVTEATDALLDAERELVRVVGKLRKEGEAQVTGPEHEIGKALAKVVAARTALTKLAEETKRALEAEAAAQAKVTSDSKSESGSKSESETE